MFGRSQLAAAALLALTLGARVLPAQEAEPQGKRFTVGVTLNSMSIDPAAAAAQQVRPHSWGMQLDAGMLLMRHLYVGMDLGPQFLSDLATFTQNTTGGEMKSTAALTYFSAMTGARTRPFRVIPGVAPIALGLYGGGSVTKGIRSIDNCDNCRSDKLEVPGGAFVQPTLVFGQGRTRLRVSDRVFVGGEGILSVISAGMEFGRR